jgi:CzcA family heavy metal efflux pump
MTRWIVGSSLKFKLLVLAVAAALMALGIDQLRSMPVETFPEFMPTRVEVQTESLGLSAEEVEQLLTNPLEQEFFNGIPWLAELRSSSLPGLSSIEMIFEPGTDMIKARQVVQERLTMVTALPQAMSKPPFVVQPVASTNRLMMIGLSSKDVSLIDMSVLARWTVAPRLMGIPGVANVAIFGLRDRQLQVLVDPAKLRASGVSMDQVIRTTGNALWASPLTYVEASTPGMGGFIDTANQRIEIQHNQPIKTAQDLAKVTVQGTEAKPLRLGDVAQVVEGHQLLIGDAVVNDAPSLMLVVERFPGANVRDVSGAVEDALRAMQPGLAGIQIDTTVYRPANFIEKLIDNLTTALLIGLVLLVLALVTFLFDWRAALISIATIVMSAATAVWVLSAFNVDLNMMIIAGLVMAIAVIVDDAIVTVDSIRRRLRQRHREQGDDSLTRDSRAATIIAACVETRGPLFVATVIIAVSAVPLLVFSGVTGSLLKPVALAYGLAILASMVVAMTIAPALALILLSRASIEGRESPVARWLERGYAAVVTRFIRRRVWTYAVVGLVVVAGLAVVPVLGGRPLTPRLQDRDLLIHWEGAAGTSQGEMDRVMAAATRELRSIPGVRNVGAHVGRALTSDQVVTVNSGQLWVSIDPGADYNTTRAAIQEVVDGYPGFRSDVMTYADQRLRQARTTRAEKDLVVRVYGSDYAVLNAKAEEVRKSIAGVKGLADPQVKTQANQPTVEIEVFIDAAARHGLKPGDVRRAAATLISGITAGQLFENQKVYDVVVWGTPPVRHSLTSIRELLIDTPRGDQVRLGDVADVRIRPNPNVIRHDKVSRSIDVVADVRGRSLNAVTADVERRLQRVTFPREHHLEVLSDAQARQSSRQLALLYIIAAAIAIFFLLQAGFGSWRLACLFFLLLPVSLAGGVLVAAVRGDDVSVVSLLGLLTVLAIAARGGILQIKHYQHLEQEEGKSFGPDLVLLGSLQRFSPTVMTFLATGLALAPLMIFGTVSGLEIVGPMSAVILGGLVTATALNLFVLPTLYLRFATRSQPRVGPPPDVADQQPEPSPAPARV